MCAELAAWDFMNSNPGPTELVTVLPGAVFGPILTTGSTGSAAIIGRMLSGRMRGVPRIGLEITSGAETLSAALDALLPKNS